MAHVILGYIAMILSAAAVPIVIGTVLSIYNAEKMSVGLILLAFFNPFYILIFFAAAIYAAIYSAIPFSVFIVIGEMRHIRRIEWYMLAAFVTVSLALFYPVPLAGLPSESGVRLFSEENLKKFGYVRQFLVLLAEFGLLGMHAAAGTFVYWKISGQHAGKTDEQMYGPLA